MNISEFRKLVAAMSDQQLEKLLLELSRQGEAGFAAKSAEEEKTEKKPEIILPQDVLDEMMDRLARLMEDLGDKGKEEAAVDPQEYEEQEASFDIDALLARIDAEIERLQAEEDEKQAEGEEDGQ